MAKRALIRFDVNTSTSASSFRQSRNKLIASARKHVATNGLKNNILNVISKNDYVHYTNQTHPRFATLLKTLQSDSNRKILYSALFHKYILRLRNPKENMITKTYVVIKESPIIRKNICHIHCFYLKYLDTMFSQYISLIQNTFDIIVTYSYQDNYVLNKYNNITFLNVHNYGMDIGPKFIIYEYLRIKQIDYNYVFYIHSKTDNFTRQKYLMPFINNLTSIATKLNEDNAHISCFFHNILWKGDNNRNQWLNNKLYVNEILDYLKVKKFKKNTLFEEGNFYILHKQVITKMFSDKLLFNILNVDNSFDYNWVKIFYNLNTNGNVRDIYNAYREYSMNKFFGNNVTTKKGHGGLADAMIEHVFERLPITMCKEYGISINIIVGNNIKCISIGHQKQTITKPEQFQEQININIPMPILSEQIIHTKLTTDTKTLCIMACHTSSDLKIKCLKRNIKYFEEIANDIVYINSTEFKDKNIIENMLYIDNDNTVCYGKYLHVLQNMDISNYDNIILTNDSYLITKPLIGFKNLFNDSIEMTSLCCSNELIKHYPDFLRRYSKNGIKKIIQFYKDNVSSNKYFLSLIHNIEVKSHNVHNSSINVLYDIIPGYNGNIHFDNTQLREYLYNKNYPIIKIKKLEFTTYTNNGIPDDFNPNEYKSLHLDLSEFNNSGVTSHFINSGMSEGRTYKKGQHLIHPDFLIQYLNEIKF